jgi:hypothetical protein
MTTRVASPSRPPTSAARKRARFSDRPVRNALLAAASLVVVAAVALFVLGPAQPATVSFNLTSYSMPGHNVVVYGKVTDASHNAVSDANVVIYKFAGGREWVLAKAATGPQGLYRIVLKHLPQSVLYVKVSKRLHGRHYLGTLRFWAHPDRACDVSVRLLHRSTIFFLPLFSY